MIVIIWQYQVKAEHITEFETIYATNGKWAQLFRKAEGYRGTELLRDLKDDQRYITIDHWDSAQNHDSFLSRWRTEYAALDAQCKGLTEDESPLGRWESISPETR